MHRSKNIESGTSFSKGHHTQNLEQRKRLAAVLERYQDELTAKMYQRHFAPEWLAHWNVDVSNRSQQYFVEKFLRPLLRLLSTSLKTDNDALLCVYLDERLRFAPHREEWSRRVEFHRDLVSRDLQIVAELCATRSIDIGNLHSLWHEIHIPLLLQTTTKRPVTLLGVGDCLLNEIRVFLPSRARRQGVALDMRCAYFSASVTGGLDVEEIRDIISKSKIDLVAFSFFSYEGMPKYVHLIEHCHQLTFEEINQGIAELMHVVQTFLLDLRRHTQAPFLIHTASGLPLRRWRKYLPFLPPLSERQRHVIRVLNSHLTALSSATENCLLVDEEAVARKNGGLRICNRQIASQRQFQGLFHTSRFGDFLSRLYLDYAAAFARFQKAKVLCIDFDNTLWRGVMADEEVHHWTERQELLLQLRHAGMLLVALSKNSEENIRWGEMALKPTDFVIQKINWNTKVQSIREAAQTLNLGTDSFVVIDDSEQERALILHEIPEVTCLDSTDESTWLQLQWLMAFPNTQQTEEAKNRTKMYQDQAQRQKAMSATVDYPEMMSSLKLWYRIGPAKSAQLNRITELIARTNQFNTTTIRYSREELIEITRTPGTNLFTVELGDKFGSLGLTAVILLREQRIGTAQTVVVDSFVMSCRAMGFSLEDQLINEIKEFSRSRGAVRIVGRYVPTDRNSPCAQLFTRNAFATISDTEFVWNTDSQTLIESIPWLNKVH